MVRGTEKEGPTSGDYQFNNPNEEGNRRTVVPVFRLRGVCVDFTCWEGVRVLFKMRKGAFGKHEAAQDRIN